MGKGLGVFVGNEGCLQFQGGGQRGTALKVALEMGLGTCIGPWGRSYGLGGADQRGWSEGQEMGTEDRGRGGRVEAQAQP